MPLIKHLRDDLESRDIDPEQASISGELYDAVINAALESCQKPVDEDD